MDPTLWLLRELVAIDSVNPSLVPGAVGEAAVAEAIAAEIDSRIFFGEALAHMFWSRERLFFRVSL